MRAIRSISLVRLMLGAAFVVVGWVLTSSPAQADEGVLGRLVTATTSTVAVTVETTAGELDQVVQDSTSVVGAGTATGPLAPVTGALAEPVRKVVLDPVASVVTHATDTLTTTTTRATHLGSVVEPVVRVVDQQVLDGVVDAVSPVELPTAPSDDPAPVLSPGVADNPVSPGIDLPAEAAPDGVLVLAGSERDVVASVVDRARHQRAVAAERRSAGLHRAPLPHIASALWGVSTATGPTFAGPADGPGPAPYPPTPGQPNAGLLWGAAAASSIATASTDLAVTTTGPHLPRYSSAAVSFDDARLHPGPPLDLGSRPG